VSPPLEQSLVIRLLQSRPIVLGELAAYSLFFSQSVENRAPKSSDPPDMRHAVGAAALDGLVTEDTQLRKVLSRVPLPGFHVTSISAFVPPIG
jgi:hypothetical protein